MFGNHLSQNNKKSLKRRKVTELMHMQLELTKFEQKKITFLVQVVLAGFATF